MALPNLQHDDADVKHCCDVTKDAKRWFILAGLFFVSFIEIGVIRSYAVILDDITAEFDVSTAYIGGVLGFVFGVWDWLAFVNTPLLRHFSTRQLVFTGGILSSLGIIFSSLAQTGAQFSLAMVLFGLGYVVIIMPTNASAIDYFPERFEIASGVLLSGGSIGVMLVPVALETAVTYYGWRGALQLLGAFNAHMMVVGVLLEPKRNEPPRNNVDKDKIDSPNGKDSKSICESESGGYKESELSETPSRSEELELVGEERQNKDGIPFFKRDIDTFKIDIEIDENGKCNESELSDKRKNNKYSKRRSDSGTLDLEDGTGRITLVVLHNVQILHEVSDISEEAWCDSDERENAALEDAAKMMRRSPVSLAEGVENGGAHCKVIYDETLGRSQEKTGASGEQLQRAGELQNLSTEKVEGCAYYQNEAFVNDLDVNLYLKIAEQPEEDDCKADPIIAETLSQSFVPPSKKSKCPNLLRKCAQFLDLGVFKDHPLLIVVCLQCFFYGTSYNGWLFFTIPNAIAKGLTTQRAAQISIAGGSANFIGRFASGFLLSKIHTKVEIVHAVISVISAAAFFFNLVTDSFELLVTLSFVLGLLMGIKAPTQLVLVMNAVGSDRFKSGVTMWYFVFGVSSPISGVMLGAIFDGTQSYDLSFCVVGVFDLAVATVTLLPLLWSKLNQHC